MRLSVTPPTYPEHDVTSSDRHRLSPTWMKEACPAWCVRTHGDDDHEEDRFHQSEPSVVPVVASRMDGSQVASGVESFDVIVRVGRYVGTPADWIALEPLDVANGRVVLTVDSARALNEAIAEQIERCAAPTKGSRGSR